MCNSKDTHVGHCTFLLASSTACHMIGVTRVFSSAHVHEPVQGWTCEIFIFRRPVQTWKSGVTFDTVDHMCNWSGGVYSRADWVHHFRLLKCHDISSRSGLRTPSHTFVSGHNFIANVLLNGTCLYPWQTDRNKH